MTIASITSRFTLSIAGLVLCALSMGCISANGDKTQRVSVNLICDGKPVVGASYVLMNEKDRWQVAMLE